MRAANPGFVFNPVSINTVQSRLSFSGGRTKADSSSAIATFRLAALAKWTTKGVANAPHQSLLPGIEVHNVTTRERAKITSGKIGPTNSIAIGWTKATPSRGLRKVVVRFVFLQGGGAIKRFARTHRAQGR